MRITILIQKRLTHFRLSNKLDDMPLPDNIDTKLFGTSGNRVGVFGNFRALGACM